MTSFFVRNILVAGVLNVSQYTSYVILIKCAS